MSRAKVQSKERKNCQPEDEISGILKGLFFSLRTLLLCASKNVFCFRGYPGYDNFESVLKAETGEVQ